MTAIYRWNGEYFGFVKRGRLFNAVADYLGWITEDGRVWRADGSFLGETYEENYILRKANRSTSSKLVARIPPIKPIQPIRKMNRIARIGKLGWVDALDEFPSPP
ncbi:4-fold beta flower protein [Chromobacterium rhizoryzae]|uniref:4-fold beta flower protein n=1 Tax=Chromobacterium rhizoryzae TaxID=1778675 RepID=UPI003857D80F